MTTHVLTGDIGDLLGATLDSPVLPGRLHAYVIALAGAVVEGAEVRIGSTELTLAAGNTFSVSLSVAWYRVEITYYDPASQSGQARFTSPPFLLDADKALKDIVLEALSYSASRPAIDHGNQSGALTITSEYGLHEINLSDDLDLTVEGPAGADMAVRVTGTGNVITLVNAQWDTAPVAAPATILLTHWITAGWRASGTGSVPDDIAPGWDYADDFTAADTTAVVGRTMPKGALAWVAMAGESLGGAEANAIITSNAVLNNDGSISTRGASAVAPALGMDVQVTYDIDTGTAATAERRAYIWLGAVDLNNTLSVQVRADGSLLCFKGGTVAVTLAGVTTGVPQNGTLRVKYLGTALTITHGAGVATATVATGTGFTGTGRRIGFAVREDGSIISDFKARVAT